MVYNAEKTTATQSHSEAGDPFAELNAKIAYAKERWGLTLFYVDTNAFWQQYGPEQKWKSASIGPKVREELARAHPGALIIPEVPNTADYQAGLPYGEADLGS